MYWNGLHFGGDFLDVLTPTNHSQTDESPKGKIAYFINLRVENSSGIPAHWIGIYVENMGKIAYFINLRTEKKFRNYCSLDWFKHKCRLQIAADQSNCVKYF